MNRRELLKLGGSFVLGNVVAGGLGHIRAQEEEKKPEESSESTTFSPTSFWLKRLPAPAPSLEQAAEKVMDVKGGALSYFVIAMLAAAARKEDEVDMSKDSLFYNIEFTSHPKQFEAFLLLLPTLNTVQEDNAFSGTWHVSDKCPETVLLVEVSEDKGRRLMAKNLSTQGLWY